MQELFKQVDALSNDDFEALINHIDKQKKSRVRSIMNEAKRQADRFLQQSNSAARPKAPVKFRHPHKPELTWSGFGRKPLWYIEYVQQGGRESDLAV